MTWDEFPEELNEYSTAALREDLDDLTAAVRAISPRVAAMDRRLAQAEATALRADRTSVDVEGSQRSMASQLKRLSARIEWLERNIRKQADGEVQLDDLTPQQRELAETAETGRREAERLLAEEDRLSLGYLVQEHAGVVHGMVRERRSGLAACEVLATTGWEEPQHRRATEDFRSAMARLKSAREELTRLAGPALRAATALAEDEDLRLRVDEVVDAGEQAADQLVAGFRARLAEAVAAGSLLPEWFTGVLGPIPPSAQTAAWMDAAVDLLTYRVTYGVTDPVTALGPPPSTSPGDADGARRLAWHRRLHHRLRQLDL